MNVNASNAALKLSRFMGIASSLSIPGEAFKTYSARIATASVEKCGPSYIELNSLRERQLRAPIDGVRLAPHVGLPRIRARFTAAARVFLAAECAADLGTRGAQVHVRDPAIAAVGRQEPFRHLQPIGEYRGRK